MQRVPKWFISYNSRIRQPMGGGGLRYPCSHECSQPKNIVQMLGTYTIGRQEGAGIQEEVALSKQDPLSVVCCDVAHNATQNVVLKYSLKESDRHQSFIISSSVCSTIFIFCHYLSAPVCTNRMCTTQNQSKRDSLNLCAMLIVSLHSHKPCTKPRKAEKQILAILARLFNLLGLSGLFVCTTLHVMHVHNRKPIKETRDSLNFRAFTRRSCV